MLGAKHNTEVGAERAIVNGLRFQTETPPALAQMLGNDRQRRLRAALGRARIDNLIDAIKKRTRKARRLEKTRKKRSLTGRQRLISPWPARSG